MRFAPGRASGFLRKLLQPRPPSCATSVSATASSVSIVGPAFFEPWRDGFLSLHRLSGDFSFTRMTRRTLLLLPLLALAGCSSDPEPALASFDGRLDRVLADKAGNLAIPGRFLYRGQRDEDRHSFKETVVEGWLVSDTPEDAEYGLADAKTSSAYRVIKNPKTGVDEQVPYRTRPVIEAAGWHLVKAPDSLPAGFAPPPAELLLSDASGTGPIEVNAHFGPDFDGVRGRNAGDYRTHRRRHP